MWDEIKQVIFDATSTTGLNPGFLGNLIAESYGLILGAIISVYIAHLLDSGREKKRQADHKGRAVTRWIKNHYEMLLSIRRDGGQGDGDHRKSERRDKVLAAIQHAEGIKDDYNDALDANKIGAAFLDYTHSLANFSEQVYQHQISTREVKGASAEAFKSLNKLVDATSPRHLRDVIGNRLEDVKGIARLDFGASREF